MPNLDSKTVDARTPEGYRVETVKRVLAAKNGRFEDVPAGVKLSDWLSQSGPVTDSPAQRKRMADYLRARPAPWGLT